MQLTRLLAGTLAACAALVASIAWGQPPPNPGASLQAAQDPREAAVLAACKNPPPPRPARPGGPGARPGAPAGPSKDYTVEAIPGVIAAGQRWRLAWEADGNVADGIVGTNDGGLLVAQNDRSDVLNDLTADSKGGVYFTNGGVFYAAPDGTVTRYGEHLRTNGIILSPDEKTLYVTNGGALAAFDVHSDGSLTNQREFVKLPGGFSDGSTIDGAGRIYVSGGPAGIHVIGSDGKYLGVIPTPFTAISVAFTGPDKKLLYAAATLREDGKQGAEIYAIQMIAQGYEGRAK